MGIFVILALFLFGVISILYIRKKQEAVRAKHPTYKHLKTGNKYGKLRDCKIKVNGEWKEGIIYCDIRMNVYVREKSDFESHFKQV